MRLQAIDALIIEAFNEIATASGAQDDAQQHFGQEVKVEAPRLTPDRSKQYANPPGLERQHPETGSEPGKSYDEDGSEQGAASSSHSDSYSKPAPTPKVKSSNSNFKTSPQKRRLQDTNVPPDSSPSIPLALTTGLTDEEYARQLQEEMNANVRGRATRGGGFQKGQGKNGKKSKVNAGNRGVKGKKVKSKAYISDSDLSGEEIHHKSSHRRERSDSDEDDHDEAKPRKKRIGGGSGGGGGGGYNKELALSESLQKVCGVPTVRSRNFTVCFRTYT